MNPLFLTLVLLLCVSADPFDALATQQPPNVVVVITDDQGWADIGYNNSAVYTPNMDRLAREGVILKQHYVMPQCTPTRIAFFTGRYPSRFGTVGLQATNQQVFPKDTFNVARLMKAAGYETALIGKWHMGSSLEFGPNHYGFDYSYGSFTGAVGNYDHRYRKGKYEVNWHRNHKFFADHENGTHTTDLVAEDAIRFIKKKRDKPFFLYLPFHAPHTPLDERGEFVDVPTQREPENPSRWLNESKIKWFQDPDSKIQQEPDPGKRLYLAVLHHLDDAIGKVVDALDESGQRKNTLLLFSSDNGPQVSWGGNAYPDDLKLKNFNQPDKLRGQKCDVWEGGIHVPGFANWPGKIEPGREINQPVHIVDWLPTLAKITNQSVPKEIELDGRDLSLLLLDRENEDPNEYPARDFYWIWSNKLNRWAVRSGDWKIVKYGKGDPQLEDWKIFNVVDDPEEKIDLSTSEPNRVQQLHDLFLRHRSKDNFKAQKPDHNST